MYFSIRSSYLSYGWVITPHSILYPCPKYFLLALRPKYMMTSSNGDISALLALCAGNSPVTGEFPSQRPVTRSFDVFFDLRLNKRLIKQSRRGWFETPSHPLWRYCNDIAQRISVYNTTLPDTTKYLSMTNHKPIGFIMPLIITICHLVTQGHVERTPQNMWMVVVLLRFAVVTYWSILYISLRVSRVSPVLVNQPDESFHQNIPSNL